MLRKKKFFKTVSMVLVFMFTSPLVAVLTICLVFSSTVLAKSPKELVVVTENLDTISVVLYHFKDRLNERDKVALKVKIEDIKGVEIAITKNNCVGVKRADTISQEQVEPEVLQVLSDHFKATSVYAVAKKM